MRAIAFTKYGKPDVLRVEEVVKPVPKEDEALIKVMAASVNSWDWELLKGTPFVNRMMFGFFKPHIKTLGADIAGKVEAMGQGVKLFRPGDEVFGDLSGCGWGGFAEYVCVPEKVLTLKPANLTFEQAAAAPQAGNLALQGILKRGRKLSGQKVLINGAGGGVGTFAIQIAKSFGAEVTGVDYSAKFEVMLSTGADHVIDYRKEDFTKTARRYDFILDVAAHHSISGYRRALNAGGSCVLVGGSLSSIFPFLFLGPLISNVWKSKMEILMAGANHESTFLKELLETGKIKPVIDRVFPLNETPQALQYLGEGWAKGKLVIKVADNQVAAE